MQEDSPYSPPKAGYAGKDHIIYEDIQPLSLTQRLNRLRYACYQLTMMVIIGLAAALLAVLSGVAGAQNISQPIGLLMAVLAAIGALAMMVYMTGLTVRRLHDLGRSGWLILLMFVPLLGYPAIIFMEGGTTLLLLIGLIQPLFMLYLFAAAGTAGMNRYGTPNPPNGMLVKVFGGIWWFLCVLALLANLVVLVLSVFAPDLLGQFGGASQQQQLEQLENLLKQF